jgi:hypothetical protein
MDSIEFGDDGGNAIPQFEQLPERALFVGDHPVNTSLKFFLAQCAGTGCVFNHPAKIAAISLCLKAELAAAQ